MLTGNARTQAISDRSCTCVHTSNFVLIPGDMYVCIRSPATSKRKKLVGLSVSCQQVFSLHHHTILLLCIRRYFVALKWSEFFCKSFSPSPHPSPIVVAGVCHFVLFFEHVTRTKDAAGGKQNKPTMCLLSYDTTCSEKSKATCVCATHQDFFLVPRACADYLSMRSAIVLSWYHRKQAVAPAVRPGERHKSEMLLH